MSSLWSQKQETIITNKQKPSPNHTYSFWWYALTTNLQLHNEFHKLITYGYDFIKKISLRISFWGLRGSMTVEASFVLPLFLFFFLSLMSMIEIIRLHGNLQVALTDTGNKLTLYDYCILACEETEGQGENSDEQDTWLAGNLKDSVVANVALSYSYVKNDILKNVGKKYIRNSPIVFGIEGLQFLGSHLFSDEDTVEIYMNYAVKPKYPMIFVSPFLLQNVYYGHAWTGYQIPGTEDETNAATKIYYVTEYGQVYHTTLECTYLKISKRQVSLWQAMHSQNTSGEKYTSCSKCKGNMLVKEVWITDSGEHYHYREDCPGLTRTIYVISERECVNYRPCGRCAASN